MEEIVYNLIREIQERKSGNGLAPTHVLRIELEVEVSKALNKLYEQGRIKVGKSLNDKWISVA